MRKQVLIVSHNQDERDLIKNLLNNFGYEILSAIACAAKPDLIILDVLIPKKNGFAACKALKSNPELAQIPVILLIGSKNDSEDYWGADMYLSTPVDQRDLLKVVFYYLSKHLLLRYEREERRQQRRTIRDKDASFPLQGVFV